jgi:hypothetical protein
LIATLAALCGYCVLMWSPLEGVDLLRARQPMLIGGHLRFVMVAYPATQVVIKVLRLISSQALWIVGSAVTGPLFGALGNEWRTARTWRSGLAIALAFCVEPLAVIGFHAVFSWVPGYGGFGSDFTLDVVAVAEVALGLMLVGTVWISVKRTQAITARAPDAHSG